jgi:hypothetical protein
MKLKTRGGAASAASLGDHSPAVAQQGGEAHGSQVLGVRQIDATGSIRAALNRAAPPLRSRPRRTLGTPDWRMTRTTAPLRGRALMRPEVEFTIRIN